MLDTSLFNDLEKILHAQCPLQYFARLLFQWTVDHSTVFASAPSHSIDQVFIVLHVQWNDLVLLSHSNGYGGRMLFWI